jgi:hypothetical protein
MADTHAYISTPQGIKWGRLIDPPFRYLDRVWVKTSVGNLPGMVKALQGDRVLVYLGRHLGEVTADADEYALADVFERREVD